MFRPLLAALILAAPAALPAMAQAPAGLRATLASAPAQPDFVVREQMWRCVGTSCTAGPANSRPLTICMALVRKAGPVTAFGAGGMEMGAALLARCNAVAAPVTGAQQ